MGKPSKSGRGKTGVKDPTVTRSVQIFRQLISTRTIGVAGAAIAAHFGRPFVVRLVTKFGLGVNSQSAGLAAGENGQVIQTVGLFAAATVGYGIGSGGMWIVHWLRWRLIRRLLQYKGWIFEQSSYRTKAWGILLKILVGTGPHKLFEFEHVLPELPLPTLDQTCKKYLETVKPLLSSEEYAHTASLVEKFKTGQGPVLQKYLQERKDSRRSWLAEWWSETAYLARREPIAINVNFYMMSHVVPSVSENQLARGAIVLDSVTSYYEMIQKGTLPPDMIMNMIPVCMESVQYMLGSCRIPGEKIDTFRISRGSQHVIVFSNGVYYRVDMYTPEINGKRTRLSKPELRKQLQIILSQTSGVTDVNAVAALTSAERSEWAKNRALLLREPINAATMNEIETAIFILALGDYTPQGTNELAREGLMGNGTSRWFDKGLTLEVFKNTTMAAANMEHSGADATHFAIMWEHSLQEEEFGPDGDLIVKNTDTMRSLPPPKRLEWKFTPEVKDVIHRTLTEYQATMETVDLIVHHTTYGKRWMKQQKVSPDGYLQMAIQLAYYRCHRQFTKTYEPASHRLFALGRTDNINPVSEHSIRWVHSMDNPDHSSAVKIRLLQDAISYQSRVRLEATAGYGSDRHLLGLECSAREIGGALPAIFTDKAYNLPMKLSTSQVPTNVGSIGVPLVHERTLGGFGPVCHDGYGLLYVGVGDDLFNFNISSWKTSPETDSSKLAHALGVAMDDMKRLMEGRNKTEDGRLDNKL